MANPLEAVTKPGGSRNVATVSTLTLEPHKDDDGNEYRCVAWNRAVEGGAAAAAEKREATVVLTVNCTRSSFVLFFSFPCFSMDFEPEWVP